DNVVRAIPYMIEKTKEMKTKPREALEKILREYDNNAVLQEAIKHILRRLEELSTSKLTLELTDISK
ncbi:MAG: phosphopantothenate/pantothenate synthetase family protein, partial [Desulfurococcaceae archaeon]